MPHKTWHRFRIIVALYWIYAKTVGVKTCIMNVLANWRGAVLLSALMGVMGVHVGAYYTTKPVIMINSVKEIENVVVRGGYINLDVVSTKLMACDVRVDRWLWRLEGDVRRWVPLWPQSGPPILIGIQQHYILSIPIPPDLPPGIWFYFSRTVNDCGSAWGPLWGYDKIFYDSPNILIEVVDPTVDKPMQIIAPPGPVTILPSEATK